jgi:membrane fusion protein (multidrug efflux system)
MTALNKEERSKEASEEKEDGQERAAQEAPPQNPAESRRKRRIVLVVLIVLVLVGSIAALIWWLYARQFESTDDAFIDGHIVAISPKVAAIVSRVYIDDNSIVKKGDPLVELDARDYQAAWVQAEGDLQTAQGKLKEAEAQVDVANADVGEAQAELSVAQTNAANANDDLQRYLALDERARSKQQMDNATAAQKSTAAQVAEGRAKVKAAEAQAADAVIAVESAKGNVTTAQGALEQARNNVDYCTITADSDGLITRKDVEPGMYVQVGQQLFSLVPTDVWVTANFKETQLDRIQPGQAVAITVDAYPDRKITGKVQSIQNGTGARFSLLPPENATGNYVKVVQRVPVKIVLDPGQNDDQQHLLSPGMSVEPRVKVK